MEPALSEFDTSLRDGRTVHVRAVRPSDEAEFVQAFERLSADARYMRFMHAVREVDRERLRRVLASFPENGIGIVASVPAADGYDIVGSAIAVSIGDGTRCEFAITVAASFGGSGLGTALMNTLIDAVKGDASQKVIYLNPTMRLKLWDLIDTASTGSRYQITKEEGMFGEMIERYGGVRLAVMRTEGDGSTLLGFDETVGGTATCTSLYCVRYDEDDGVCGVYNHGGAGKLIMVEETKRVNGQPLDRLLFEGYYGQVVHQQRALARLTGITNA